jgi:hypothetical protein
LHHHRACRIVPALCGATDAAWVVLWVVAVGRSAVTHWEACMTRLRALWSGDLPLGEAFWTYAVGIGLALNLITTLLFLVLLSWDRPVAALFVGHALAVPYNLVALVGVWRSAARYGGGRIRADLARIVSLVGMVLLSLI